MFSGLTVGYMGIDPLEMEVKEKSGTEEEKAAAKRIRPLLSRHHVLLATLLLANSLVVEALPIFMDELVPSWVAILLSTTVILIFGEVLPQAYCTGPDQIQIAAQMAPVTELCIWILLPVTYFIGMALDKVLGVHEKKRYDRRLLIDIIGLHVKQSSLVLIRISSRCSSRASREGNDRDQEDI